MSNFQRRHYEYIAMILGGVSVPTRHLVTESFVRALKRDNPAFDPDKFRERVEAYAKGIVMS